MIRASAGQSNLVDTIAGETFLRRVNENYPDVENSVTSETYTSELENKLALSHENQEQAVQNTLASLKQKHGTTKTLESLTDLIYIEPFINEKPGKYYKRLFEKNRRY